MQGDRISGSFFAPPTLVELLRHRASYQPNEQAFVFLVDGESETVEITYAELDRQARRLAAQLINMDLQGERALLLYPAGLEFIIAFFGCLYAGVVAVPAYPPRRNRSLERIQAIVADAEAPVALTTAAVLERTQPVLDQTPDLRNLKWVCTDRIQAGMEDQWTEPLIRGDSLAFLQYTSGSTGTPKGVMLTHGNLLHNSALIGYAFEHTRSGVGIFWLPSYHDMGLVGGILQPIYMGRPNVLMSPVSFLTRPVRWLQAISRYRGTTSGGPNFAYELCVSKISDEQKAELDLSSWLVAFNGAEPVRAETIDKFCAAFASCGFRREAFYPCYGLAESTLLVTGGYQALPPIVESFDVKHLETRQAVKADPYAPDSKRLVSSGQNLPDQKIAIVDPETHIPVRAGQIGEIWVKGPSIAGGYWKRREETEHTFRAQIRGTGEGPFLRTGDLGFFAEKELFVAGRLKDLIIIRGANHYPQDIELTVERSHEEIRPSCGAAFTVDQDSEKLVVVYEVERRPQAVLADILHAVRSQISRDHELQVDSIVLVKAGSIPKTSSGKIQRHACRAAFLSNALEVVAQWHSQNGNGSAAGEMVVVAPAHSFAEARDAKVDLLNSRESAASEFATSEIADAEEPAPISKHHGKDGPAPQVAAPVTSVERRALVADSSPPAGGDAVVATVLEEVRKIARERAAELTLDTPIAQLGLDSLERMEIVTALEQRFGGRFPEEVVTDMETCRDVVEAVERNLVPVVRQEVQRDTVPEENFRFEMNPEYLKLKQRLALLDQWVHTNPFFNVHERVTTDTTVIGGRELINFSSYNYVGMSGDPIVAQAAKAAIDRYGTSVSASRLVSGEKAVHQELEQAIAEFVGAEDCIVYVGGHSTNETTIGHLFGPGDLILHDALAHNSIIQGCILSGARRRPFPHNDWSAVNDILGEIRHDYRRVLIAIEGVYSMDGDIPDLPKFVDAKKKHHAFLMVDEAHSIGVLGEHGRGIGEYFHVQGADVDLWMGTLSKTFGSCGGYIAGCKAVVEYLKYTAPGFVYSVGLSPPNAAAALASLKLLKQEPFRVERLRDRSRLFLQLCHERRLNTGMSRDSAVIPVILGNSAHCLRLSRAMLERGVNVQPILYPAVEERAARLRFFITSLHTQQQIQTTVAVLAEELAKIDPRYVRADTR